MTKYRLMDTATAAIVLEEVPNGGTYDWVLWLYPLDALNSEGTQLHAFQESDRIRAVGIASRWAYQYCRS